MEAASRVLEEVRDQPLDPENTGRALEAATAVLALVEARARLLENIIIGALDPATGIERFNAVPAAVVADAEPDVLLRPWSDREHSPDAR